MTQAQHIIDRFSDSFLAAKLEGTDTAGVLASYQQAYPELDSQLLAQSRSLGLLYGYLGEAGQPTNAEIASAYKRFVIPEAAPHSEARTQAGFISRVASLFASQATYRLTAGMAVVVFALFLWQPWATNPTLSPVLAPSVSDHDQNTPLGGTPGDGSSAVGTPASPTTEQFRGANDQTGGRKNSAEELLRLKHRLSLTGQISQPKELELEPAAPHIVKLHWQPVDGALSYIIEIKTENDQSYHAVAQVAHANARIGSLASGQSVSVRVTATKGQAKGPASDAQSIVVP